MFAGGTAELLAGAGNNTFNLRSGMQTQLTIKAGGGHDLLKFDGGTDEPFDPVKSAGVFFDGGGQGGDGVLVDDRRYGQPRQHKTRGNAHFIDGVASLEFKNIKAFEVKAGFGGAHMDARESNIAVSYSGGPGNDTLYGSRFNDRLFGGAGNDFVRGGKGNDTVRGNLGDDDVHGEEGDDSVIA
jgi:Ca2+-binding RTX toxin-like protein